MNLDVRSLLASPAGSTSTAWPLRDSERLRLRRHFSKVLDLLGRRAGSGTTRERRRLLRELERYAAREAFPENRMLFGRTPIFVDDAGNYCAVAHLMRTTGAHEQVKHIRWRHNFARVEAVAPLLSEWLGRSGFTLQEAALIQPSYCSLSNAEYCLCDYVGSGATGVLEGTVVGDEEVRIDVIHGDAPNHAAGDVIQVNLGFGDGQPGDIALVTVTDGAPAAGAIALGTDGTFRCNDLTASREQVLAALVSSDCATTLEAVDTGWGESNCGCGCAVGPTSWGPGAGALAAVTVMALIRRRRERR